MAAPPPLARMPIRIAGSLTVTHADDRFTITGHDDRVVIASDSMTTLNELRQMLQEIGDSMSSDKNEVSDSSSDRGPFDFLRQIDLTVEVHLRGERIARFGPGAKTNWAAKALGLKDAELSVGHFVKAAFSRG